MPSCTPKGAETLHGSPKKDPSQENNKEEKLLIITKDFIRTLRIPQKEPQRKALTLPSAEFEQIISTSRFLVKEEREALKKTYEKEKEEKMKAAGESKCQIQEADLSLSKNRELSDLELEAQNRAQRLVERADDLKMEEEDEIKQLNQLILGTQCQATCDTQIEEKKQIKAELAEEEKRLDTMMEEERRKVVESLEKSNELRKQRQIRGRQEICDQIQQNLEERQLQEELKEQEKLQLHKEQENRNHEDLKALEKKLLEKKLLQEEITRINAEVAKAKERRSEEEKQADLRAMEYLQKKLDREAEYEAEQKRVKKEKELEIARLRAQQQRAKDYKAEQDEIRAKRRQEAEERRWRQKEKELAIKKARDEATLRAARLEQVQNKEYCLSMEAGREKATFERVLKVQQEEMAKQKEEEEKKRQKAQQHALAIRQQVKERELSAAAKRKEMFKEANRRLEEAKQRQSRLAEIKEKKLQQLRAVGLSEKYCAQVERKAEKLLHPHSKN
ncbi:cilia- and flagella-associated protein 45 [Oryzias melastigma]|uniref:Cilia- and flagella-associated protein 45 n=1 Tax=Oryzias melastigma TaxID=30732 RepID=A0A3B3DQL1_ORYME|nr:cilia- and flagella-associated protein 45 [Oryzias melastigma]